MNFMFSPTDNWSIRRLCPHEPSDEAFPFGPQEFRERPEVPLGYDGRNQGISHADYGLLDILREFEDGGSAN